MGLEPFLAVDREHCATTVSKPMKVQLSFAFVVIVRDLFSIHSLPGPAFYYGILMGSSSNNVVQKGAPERPGGLHRETLRSPETLV